ncbi:hypothetical protein AURDEDRAFT_169829 [Auricularia subglabra TFB-10046 SS5]|nr:hypothetical protein AURDEDRAFT_169829 [Auricularia subglabra TFB-10046 SS5]
MSTPEIALNGTVDRLGDDELGYIMSLVVGDTSSIPVKLALGQVSHRWRRVAACTPSVWSKFTVKTRGDAFSVPTVMKRARGALIDVSLDFGLREEPKDADTAPTVPLIDLNTRSGIYASLKPQMHRIRTLSIDFGQATSVVGPDEPLDDLFSFAVPRMEHLAIHWRTSRWQSNPLVEQRVKPIVIPLELPTETPPRLRSISLTNVVPVDWNAVVFPTIEQLHIDAAVDDPDLLRGILETCPRLEHLTFLPFCLRGFTFEGPATVAPGHRLCPNLRSVHVGSPFGNIWEVLCTVVSRKTLDAITVNMRDEARDVEVRTVARAILPGLGPLVSFSLAPTGRETFGNQILTLEDATGRARRIIVADAQQRQTPFAHLWSHLATNGELGAVQRVKFAQRDWVNVVAAFRRHPPRHPNLEIRIVLDAGDQYDERFVSMLERQRSVAFQSEELQLRCPTLEKLTFDVGDALPEKKRAVVFAILDSICLRHGLQPTQVCIANCSQRHLWISSMNHALASRTGWALCGPGCSHL